VPQGKVKWFSTEKAYGFIAQENDNDIFVHVTGLAEGVTTLEPDQLVEFEVVQGRKGQQAANVRPATQAAPAPEAAEAEAEEAEAEEVEPAEAEPAEDEPVEDEVAQDEPAEDEPEPAAEEGEPEPEV
jgi:cold shock protein